MKFDFIIKSGNATSRNAIKLLSMIGYNKETVQRADNIAKLYLSKGTWEEK